MHEFSIAVSMVDIALEYAAKSNAEIVNEIELEIGELSGVVMDAMTMAMSAATKGTLLENARVKIVEVPGKARCRACGHTFRIRNIFDPCPQCGGFNPEIISGKELRVKSLNIE